MEISTVEPISAASVDQFELGSFREGLTDEKLLSRIGQNFWVKLQELWPKGGDALLYLGVTLLISLFF
jgi:hypothetical protein